MGKHKLQGEKHSVKRSLFMVLGLLGPGLVAALADNDAGRGDFLCSNRRQIWCWTVYSAYIAYGVDYLYGTRNGNEIRGSGRG